MNSNASHNEIDHTIDRALSTLRHTRPRSGLNARILATLEHRAADPATNPGAPSVLRTEEPGGPSFHGLIVKGWGIARGSAREDAGHTTSLPLWPAAAAAAAVVAVAALVTLHHRSPSVEQSNNTVILSGASQVSANKNTVILSGASPRDAQPKDPEDINRAKTAEPFSTSNLSQPRPEPITQISRHPEQSASARSRWTPVFVSCPGHQPTGCPIHDGSAVVGGVQTDPDAQALADLHTPSYPAPPLPLTPQEELFLSMYRAGNETLLAEVDPLVRAERDATETAQFETFFRDRPHIHQPGDDE